MLVAALFAASPAAAPPVAEPPPPALMRVICFDTPLFFEPGARDLAGEDKRNLEKALAWLAREPVRREVRVVLRMNTRENPYDEPNAVPFLDVRPDDMRRLLIAKGIPHDRILIANEMWGDRNIEREWDLKDFKGAWIQPEFYLTSRTLDRLRAEVPKPTPTLDPDPCAIPPPASAPASPPSPPAGPSAPEPAATRPPGR